ncbi:hypothetical protein GCM10028808_40170 [Spirosoma migulaei]
MKNLKELVKEIESNYPNDKYLYRGEHKLYSEIKPTSARDLKFKKLTEEHQKEVYAILTGHMYGTDYQYDYSTQIAGLYYFLREAIFGIGILDAPSASTLEIDAEIFGIFQHYGFSTAFIDLTDDINVAAHFSSAGGVVGSEGRIMIIPKDRLNKELFNGTSSLAQRPFRQRAYFLLIPEGYDLLSDDFIRDYDVKFLKFHLSENDKTEFNNSDLLSTNADQVADDIRDWYATHIKDNGKISQPVKDYIDQILKGWPLK